MFFEKFLKTKNFALKLKKWTSCPRNGRGVGSIGSKWKRLDCVAMAPKVNAEEDGLQLKNLAWSRRNWLGAKNCAWSQGLAREAIFFRRSRRN
jgi:hypothetical protein